MLVREIMTAPAFSIHADADLNEALQLLAERRITAVPVVDAGNKVVGVLSEIDVLRRAVEPDARAHATPLAESEPLPKTVAEIMTTDPRTTTEGADVSDLIDLFTHTSFKSLPVVREGDWWAWSAVATWCVRCGGPMRTCWTSWCRLSTTTGRITGGSPWSTVSSRSVARAVPWSAMSRSPSPGRCWVCVGCMSCWTASRIPDLVPVAGRSRRPATGFRELQPG